MAACAEAPVATAWEEEADLGSSRRDLHRHPRHLEHRVVK